MSQTNRAWVLASHPTGMPEPANWRLEERPVPALRDGQVSARAVYLSVDPYMRGRISAKSNYAAGVGIGDVMHGGGVGQIEESRHPKWKAGDYIETMGFGWQERAILNGDGLTRVDPALAPLHAYLSYLGMPGRTAWLALDTIGKPKPGETVLVSAASGAVGQVVGQIAKAGGARAVAVASSQEKLDWCAGLGYDAGVNYRAVEDLDSAIGEACPGGVDVYFDNTAGPIHDAAMRRLNQNARIIICGTISLAGKFEEPDMGERFLRQILVSRATVQGFLVFDHVARYPEANAALAKMANEGRLTFKTDIEDGIEAMPGAFLSLLHGENFGKKVVRTGPDRL